MNEKYIINNNNEVIDENDNRDPNSDNDDDSSDNKPVTMKNGNNNDDDIRIIKDNNYNVSYNDNKEIKKYNKDIHGKIGKGENYDYIKDIDNESD